MELSCVRVTDHDQSGLPVLEGCKIMDDDVAPAFNRPLSNDEKNALDLWVNGLGNSAKRFAGENPMPPKRWKASRNSWHIREMPSRHERFRLGMEITATEKAVLEYGHIPEAMEDHWFMYFEDSIIHYHRSWTGYCIFEARIEPEEDHFIVTEARVNRYPGHYKETDVERDRHLLARLIMDEIGRH